MTLDELDAAHETIEAKLSRSTALVPVRKPGTAMTSNVNVPEATKVQLPCLKDGKCPTCGGDAGAFVFDNICLFFCRREHHHRFKETFQ